MEPFVALKSQMPLDPALVDLARLWPADRPLFVVGGAVRDWVRSIVHADKFKPKDFDLASQLSADEVMGILQSHTIPFTAQGAAFGIIVARPNDREFEIASFRTEWYDPEAGDGRRPDHVEQGSTPGADAARRDLYINALFYSLIDEEVRDYNGGKGFEDIKLRRVRVVGNPRHRFQEDKLRIPRLIRFFCRFNSGNILDYLDAETVEAVHEFKHLAGVSPERKLAEFLAGVESAQNPIKFVQALAAFPSRNGEPSLLQAMFPGMNVQNDAFEGMKHCPLGAKAILSWLFRDNDPAGFTHPKTGLGNRLKFPAWLTDGIEFILGFDKWNFDPKTVGRMVKRRDKFYRPDMNATEQHVVYSENYGDLNDWSLIANKGPDWWNKTQQFLNYYSAVKAQSFIDKGMIGKSLGEAIRQAEEDSYKTFMLNQK